MLPPVAAATTVKSNSAKGRIVVLLSSLVTANAFARCVRWASTFAVAGEQCAMDSCVDTLLLLLLLL